MKRFKDLFINVLILVIAIIPFYNMVINGIYKWHIQQPEFIQGGLELVIFSILIFVGYLINKKRIILPLILFSSIYLSMNGVIIPVLLDISYFLMIIYVGYSFGKSKNDKKNAEKILYYFFNGFVIWSSGAIILSLLRLGTINDLRIYCIALLLSSLIYNRYNNKNLNIEKIIGNINNFKIDSIVKVLFYIVISAIVLCLFAKTNTCIDYDSLWYGLRSEYVLVGEHSFYDNLGYVTSVYFYPKLSELFFLPLSGLGDYSFVICANILVYILSLICLNLFIDMHIKLDKKKYLNVLLLTMIAAIPALANISATAKGDILGFFLLIYSFYLINRYNNNKDNRDFIFSLLLILISTAVKLTYILWGGILLIYNIAVFLKSDGRLSKKISFLWQDIFKNKIIIILSVFTFFGIHLRTFILTNYFIYPVGINIWNKLFNLDHGFFLVKTSASMMTTEVINLNYIFDRISNFMFNPGDLSHVIMLWTSNILIISFILFIFNKKKKANITDILFICINIAVMIYYMITMPNPDGNYFIFPIIIISLMLLKTLKITLKKFSYNIYFSTITLIIISLFIIMFVSHPSWSWGTKKFSRELIVDNFETKTVNRELFKNNGTLKIYDEVKKFNITEKVISSAVYDSLYFRLPCNLESFYNLKHDLLSNAKYYIYENFVNVNNKNNIKAFVVANSDQSVFPSLVKRYIEEFGYDYILVDESAVLYVLK